MKHPIGPNGEPLEIERKFLIRRPAEELLAQHSIACLELEQIYIQVHPENVPSIRLARKLERDFPGFVRLTLAN